MEYFLKFPAYLQFRALSPQTQAVIWVIMAVLFDTMTVMLVKLLAGEVHVAQILVLRQAIMLILIFPFIAGNLTAVTHTAYPLHQIARGLLAALGMYAGFTAFPHLALADATALGFSRSFLTTIFAIIILKEVVGLSKWSATIVGFAGILIMLKPTGDGINGYGLLVIANAAAAALSMIIIRYVSRRDTPSTNLFYQTVLIGLFATSLAFLQWEQLTRYEYVVIMCMGLTSVVAHSCSIRAYSSSKAALVAPFDYTRLLWAGVAGLIIFGEIPSWNTVVGASVVILALFCMYYWEIRKNRRQVAT